MNSGVKIIFTSLLFLAASHCAKGQDNCVTLTQLIGKYYGSNSPQLLLVSKNFKVKYLTYQNKMAVYHLSSKVDVSLPYSKSIESVLQPDGNAVYTPRTYLSPIYTITTAKKIPLTGGTIGITSSLSYFKNFLNANQQYNANWYSLFISQPFFAFNEYKYDKKLQKLTLRADSVQYFKDRETKLLEVITKVIDYEVAKHNIKNGELNIANYTAALYKVKLLYEHGRMLAVDTLTLYNNLKQAYLQQEQLTQDLNIKKANLNYYFPQSYDYTICNWEEPNIYQLDSALLNERYMHYNNANQLLVDAFVNAENVERAQKAHGVTTSISAGNGINQSATTFEPLFNNPAQKQSITLAISVPLTGWQAYKRNKEIANLQNQAYEISKSEMVFLAKEWTREQLNTYSYLFKSYQFSKEKLSGLVALQNVLLDKIAVGKASTTDYNTTQAAIFAAQLEQLDIVKQIVLFRFELRSKTLYDFELGESVN